MAGYRRALKLAALVLLMAAGGTAAGAQSTPADGFDHGHATLDGIADRYFTADGVRYAALKANRGPLDAYVARLAAVSADEFDGWTRDQQMAYLINAYNALVVEQVIDNYPISRRLALSTLLRPGNSVWQIGGFFDGIPHRVAGRQLTLDDIEHGWLRPEYEDPRIHFAIVCAARSCPPLRTEAYTADRLDAQLDDQAREFFNGERNQFDRAEGEVRLSKIFDWFGEDFAALAPSDGYRGDAEERGILALAAEHLPAATARWLRQGEYEIEYLDYDWELNDVGSP